MSGPGGAGGADPRWLAGIAADLLGAGRGLALLSRGVTLVWLFAMIVGFTMAGRPELLPAAALAIALGIAGEWLALRVAFDAALFERLAADPDLATFDDAMTALALLPSGKTGRPLAARAAGARRLLRIQGGAVLLQIVLPCILIADRGLLW